MSTMTALLALMVPAQLVPSPDPRPIPISGVVVNAAGNPVADADVWLTESQSPSSFRRFGTELALETVVELEEAQVPVLAHARTGPRGGIQCRNPSRIRRSAFARTSGALRDPT
jgi:hypothetical protein